jgi:hypothetical protein
MSSTKNSHLCYIPQHVIVDQVESVLNDHEVDAQDKKDTYIRHRIIASLEMLHVYAEALQQVRPYGREYLEKYPNGM